MVCLGGSVVVTAAPMSYRLVHQCSPPKKWTWQECQVRGGRKPQEENLMVKRYGWISACLSELVDQNLKCALSMYWRPVTYSSDNWVLLPR